ncbi:MAG: hypothetical protein AcusKO_41400 [Acuticoccus sp.]
MALADLANNPAMVVVAGIGILLLLWLGMSLRGPGGGRTAGKKAGARAQAAMQAERDSMRANHAVEIAALEKKLADALVRAQAGSDTPFRLKELESARDAARTEAKELGEALDEAKAALARVQAEGEAQTEIAARLARERDQVETALQGEKGTATSLRNKLQESADVLQRLTAAQSELSALKEREAALVAKAGEHEATIATLRETVAAASGKVDGAEVDTLRQTTARHAEREKKANETLSQLSYEHDGLKNRFAAAERSEREARAASEKSQAMLELRQQKIYALEERLREQDGTLQAALRRAEVAEETAATLRKAPAGGADASAADARVKALEAALERAGTEEHRLRGELEALQQTAPAAGQSYEEAREIAEALSAAQAEAEELRGEVARLSTAAPAGDGPAEIKALRRAIRTLAERFVEDAEDVLSGTVREQSLTDRIRAYKATRDPRRPLRIAAPKQ